MFGVSSRRPLPPSLLVMIGLLRNLQPGLSVSEERPKQRPESFIVVDYVGGSADDTGTLAAPTFAIQCYAMSTGDAERLCGDVLAQLQGIQFQRLNDTQLRGWETLSLPVPFPDPLISDRRRWQLLGTLGMSNIQKG